MITRAISALIAVALLVLLGIYAGTDGFIALTFLVALLVTWEGKSLLFYDSPSKLIRAVFIVCNLLIFTIFVLAPEYSEVGFAMIAMGFCSLSLFIKRKFAHLSALTAFQARSIMGFVYLGILPAFSARLLYLDQGMQWFLFLMAAVFAGDTFAYIFGRLFGKRKLMPVVSPQKTIEGSIGGLAGSAMAGLLFSIYVFPDLPSAGLLILALVAGLFAQLGDLFESLLKRVASIKDSGKIMPGHGGILDRIDGILFASPIVLAGAMILATVFR